MEEEMLIKESNKRKTTRHPKIGEVIAIRDGICEIRGLAGAKAGEIICLLPSTIKDFSKPLKELVIKAIVLNLGSETVSAMVLGNDRLIAEGCSVIGTGDLFTLKSSLALFGHVINSLGDIIDGGLKKNDEGIIGDEYNERVRKHTNHVTSIFGGWTQRVPLEAPINFKKKKEAVTINFEEEEFVEKKAKGIIDRVPVRIPLLTGTIAVDSLVPIGRGQRELIIGDRQTGKTTIGIDAILNYKFHNNYIRTAGASKEENNNIRFLSKSVSLSRLREIVWFVYCGIGQKQSSISGIATKLKKKCADWYTAIVSATSSESASLQFLAPYTACTLGEFIRDWIGGHAVVIFDDLSKHAVAYRQMSLLLRRPPGREAFPGDVFYVHSRLLERAGALSNHEYSYLEGSNLMYKIKRRGTLTAFPIIETQAGDVSAYIPTNVISITDGQIFLESELFYRGIRPAVNVGLSVSRVGSTAQPQLMKSISGSLKMELAQFREIENFTKLGADLDNHTRRLLMRGENLIEILKQDVHSPVNTFKQTLNLFFGLGISGKLLTKLNKIKENTTNFIFNQRGVSSTRLSKPIVFSGNLTKVSWLEYIRFYSTNFLISDVKIFLANLTKFVSDIGLTELAYFDSVNNLNHSFLTKLPASFFNDIALLFLVEFGNLTIRFKKFAFTRDNLFERFSNFWECKIFDVYFPSSVIEGTKFSIESIDISSIIIPKLVESKKRVESKLETTEKEIDGNYVKANSFYRLMSGANVVFDTLSDTHKERYIIREFSEYVNKKVKLAHYRLISNITKLNVKGNAIVFILKNLLRLSFSRDLFIYEYFTGNDAIFFKNKKELYRVARRMFFKRVRRILKPKFYQVRKYYLLPYLKLKGGTIFDNLYRNFYELKKKFIGIFEDEDYYNMDLNIRRPLVPIPILFLFEAYLCGASIEASNRLRRHLTKVCTNVSSHYQKLVLTVLIGLKNLGHK